MLQSSDFKTIIILLTATLLWLPCHAHIRMVSMGERHDSIPFSTITDAGLMVIDIFTENGEWPTCNYIWAPTDAWGQSITNVTKVPGRLVLKENDQILYDSGDYVEDLSGMTISLRGNSSAFYAKKPYKIKLSEKADLLCRNNPNFNDKHWVLIADESLKAFQGFELSRLLGMTWVPAFKYVNVVINDVYCGVYLLLESVRRNTNCRLNVKSDGFIFESSAYWWNEPFYIQSYLGMPLHYIFKYPDPEDLTSSQINYMTSLLYDYELSLYNGTYPDYIDVTSFASWTLGQDILATNDYAGINRYYLKYDASASTKFVMPMMWDFDSSELLSQDWSNAHMMLMDPLFSSENPAFIKEYVRQWRDISPTLYNRMSNIISNLHYSPQGSGISNSITLDNMRWDKNHSTYSFYYSRAQWFKTRTTWINENIEAIVMKGDVNFDKTVDVSDINIIINIILSGDSQDISDFADLNGDGEIDVEDVNIAINIILSDTPDTP